MYQVVQDLFYDRNCVANSRPDHTLAQEHGTVEAAQYRDAVGLGRKRAIQILEFFDRVGHTRRVRDSHVLRSDRLAPSGAAELTQLTQPPMRRVDDVTVPTGVTTRVGVR